MNDNLFNNLNSCSEDLESYKLAYVLSDTNDSILNKINIAIYSINSLQKTFFEEKVNALLNDFNDYTVKSFNYSNYEVNITNDFKFIHIRDNIIYFVGGMEIFDFSNEIGYLNKFNKIENSIDEIKNKIDYYIKLYKEKIEELYELKDKFAKKCLEEKIIKELNNIDIKLSLDKFFVIINIIYNDKTRKVILDSFSCVIEKINISSIEEILFSKLISYYKCIYYDYKSQNCYLNYNDFEDKVKELSKKYKI